MPRSLNEILDQADTLAKRFEDFEPTTDGNDAAALRAVREAFEDSANAQRRLPTRSAPPGPKATVGRPSAPWSAPAPRPPGSGTAFVRASNLALERRAHGSRPLRSVKYRSWDAGDSAAPYLAPFEEQASAEGSYAQPTAITDDCLNGQVHEQERMIVGLRTDQAASSYRPDRPCDFERNKSQ